MLRRAFLLLCSPLLAACPTFTYGPEAFEVGVDTLTCQQAGFEPGCSRFAFDNGVIYTEPGPQVVVLRMGFESDERNLAHLELEYEVPGMPSVRHTCSLPTGAGEVDGNAAEIDDQGFGCALVGLADAPVDANIDVTRSSMGVLEIDASLTAAVAGSYAISAWLTDDNGFESPRVRWPFLVETRQ